MVWVRQVNQSIDNHRMIVRVLLLLHVEAHHVVAPQRVLQGYGMVLIRNRRLVKCVVALREVVW